MLKAFFKILIISLITIILYSSVPTFAAPMITEVKVSLGDRAGNLKFIPNHFNFAVGQKYKLVLENPSATKHYFTAKDFFDASWTQKIQAGKVEIKGAIHDLELKPMGQVEWFFVPMKPGIYKLYCSIPNHAEAGMTGEIVITASSI